MSGHQFQQSKPCGILAGIQFLFSKICMCLASLNAYRRYEIGPTRDK